MINVELKRVSIKRSTLLEAARRVWGPRAWLSGSLIFLLREIGIEVLWYE
jgi:hypothetical protein